MLNNSKKDPQVQFLQDQLKMAVSSLVNHHSFGDFTLNKEFAFVDTDESLCVIRFNINDDMCIRYNNKLYSIFQINEFLKDNPHIFEIVGEKPDINTRDDWKLINIGNQQCIIADNALIGNQILNMMKIENHI